MIKKLSIIGLSIIFGKIFLFVLPYSVNADTYNEFNQVYYTASLAVSIAVFGFNISFVENPVMLRVLFLLVFINLIPVYLFILIMENSIDFEAVLISYSLILTGIITFYFLFKSNIWLYFFSHVILLVAQLSAILLVILSNMAIEFAFMLMMLVSLVVISLLLKFNYKPTQVNNIKKFYEIGVSAFVINGAAVIAFNADKFIINNFFSLDTANAYTFAWTLIAPSFYIGTLIEKGIYSEKAESKLFNKTKKYTLILFAALVIYFGILTAAVTYYPNIIPGSLQHSVFQDILYIMIPGFFLFTLLHTPVNAILFKLFKDKIRSKIALFFAPVIILFLISLFIITRFDLNDDVLLILSITWLYLFVLQTIKIYLMYTKQKLIFI